MTLETIDAIYHGYDVARFHTHPTLRLNTVGHHSAGVAAMVYVLMQSHVRKEVIIAALFDDIGEYWTGDIPSPFKRSVPGLRDSLRRTEDKYKAAIGIQAPILTEQEYTVLKLADALDGLCFCTAELRRGNQEIASVGDTFFSYVATILATAEFLPTSANELAKLIAERWQNCRARIFADPSPAEG